MVIYIYIYLTYIDIHKYITITDIFLGKGATGIVREGHNSNLEKFAIKTVWKADIEKNECFKKEIDITLDLDNEFIIKCYEIYEDNSAIHLVLENIQGGDLFDHIIHSQNRKLRDQECFDLIEQILRALNYLHNELNVVHRDIKPENFLIYNENGRNKIKLIDFGFSSRLAPNETLTQQLGTPLYAAPEIFEEREYSYKVDMWSAGVVLYNMANGMHPFSNDMDSIKDQVLNREINFNDIKNNNLKKLCKGLLERDQEKRLNSIQALSMIEKWKKPDQMQDTTESNFKPDINKILYILNNDRALGDELRNLFLECLSIDELKKLSVVMQNHEGAESDSGMLVGKIYLKADKLISLALGEKWLNGKFKMRLMEFKDAKQREKLQKQMINVTRFFNTAIESKKFIQKQRIWHEFRSHDKKSVGFLTETVIHSIFKDPVKKKRITRMDSLKNCVQFEDFYRMKNEYEGIKEERTSSSKIKEFMRTNNN